MKLDDVSTPTTDAFNQIYAKSNELYILDTIGNERKILSSNVLFIENKHIINSVETISVNTTLSSSNANIINIDNCILTLPNASNLLSFLIIGTGIVISPEGLNVDMNGDKLKVVSNGSSWHIV